MASSSFLPLGFLGIALAVWLASSCTHSSRDITPDTPEDKTAPSGCQGFFWYDFSQDDSDPGHYGKIDYVHWDKLRRTSSHVMVKQRDFGTDPEGWGLLLARIRQERWPGAVFLGNIDLVDGSPRQSAETFAELCLAIRNAGIRLDYALYSDEPDLGPERYGGLSMREYLDRCYDAGKAALRQRGIDDIKLGQMWSLYGEPDHNWESRVDGHGWPKMDFIGCDGLYTGRPEHLHVVTARVNRFLDRYSNEVNDTAPIVLVLKAWSEGEEAPMCWDWLHKQLKAGLTGEPPYGGYPVLNAKHRSRVVLVGFFHMKVDAQDGVFSSGGNTSELIDGLARFAGARDWSMDATESPADD